MGPREDTAPMTSTLTAEPTFGSPSTGESWRRPFPHEKSPIHRMLFRAAMALDSVIKSPGAQTPR